MGNLISCGLIPSPSQHVLKIVHCNGLVDEFYMPVRVGELIVDYPDHFICHSSDLNILQNVPPLPDDEEMEVGQVYFLLPRTSVECPLTDADVATLLSKAAITRKASYKDFDFKERPTLRTSKPQLEMRQIAETTQVTVSREFVLRLLEETRLKMQNMSFPSKVYGSELHMQTPASTFTAWRPKLATIEEGNFLLG